MVSQSTFALSKIFISSDIQTIIFNVKINNVPRTCWVPGRVLVLHGAVPPRAGHAAGIHQPGPGKQKGNRFLSHHYYYHQVIIIYFIVSCPINPKFLTCSSLIIILNQYNDFFYECEHFAPIHSVQF